VKPILAALVLAIGFLSSILPPGDGPDLLLPGASTPTLVPLLWTQGQPAETIRRAVREVADSGNTGFVWESRPHPDYLGPRWWADLGVAVDEARRRGLEIWIFDEWMYPSGIAGGKVVAENPGFTHHVVVDRSAVFEGPRPEGEIEIPGGLKETESVVSVAAFPAPFGREANIVDLSAARTGPGRVRWAVPSGRWNVVWCVSEAEAPRGGWRMDTMIDVLNPEAVAAFIRLTHEETYRRFGAEFGKTIKGFFSDETGFRNVTSYESLPGKPGQPMPWSPAFVAYFKRLMGYDPGPLLPALWYDLGLRGRGARFDLMDAYARGLAEIFFAPQRDWCRAHGVRFIGHLVEDNHADANLGYGPAHWFRSIGAFDMPGIDIVGYQVTPGLSAGTNRWVPDSGPDWDQEFFQFGLPAMARGAALIEGTNEIFSEAFGAYGWSEGLGTVKWIGDWHFVNGIGVLSPHAMTMKFNDPDCPPHFNRMSGNPQWMAYAAWAAYAKRLQSVVVGTGARYDAAVLYTAESRWVGPAQAAAPVVRALESRLVSTVVLPYETWEKDGAFARGRWSYKGQTFGLVVLPSVKYIPAKSAIRLAEFAEAGGRVVVIDRWPAGSVDGRADAEVRAAVERLKKSPSAALLALPEIGPALGGVAGAAIAPATENLVVSRRAAKDGDWVLLHNRSLDDAWEGRLVIRGAAGTAAGLDAAGGKWRALRSRPAEGGVEVELRLFPGELGAIWISPSAPAAAADPAFSARAAVRGPWRVLVLDEEGGEANDLGEVESLGDWRRFEGLAGFAGTLRYKIEAELPALGDGEALGIDLGRVGEVSELKVNGRSLGYRLAPPHRWDITASVRPGRNVFEVDVTNTAAARWPDSFSHGDPPSGLFGPVELLSGRKGSR
jgi:hypothetical protein